MQNLDFYFRSLFHSLFRQQHAHTRTHTRTHTHSHTRTLSLFLSLFHPLTLLCLSGSMSEYGAPFTNSRRDWLKTRASHSREGWVTTRRGITSRSAAQWRVALVLSASKWVSSECSATKLFFSSTVSPSRRRRRRHRRRCCCELRPCPEETSLERTNQTGSASRTLSSTSS